MTDGKSWLSSIHGHLLKWAAGILLSVAIILYLGADLPQWLADRFREWRMEQLSTAAAQRARATARLFDWAPTDSAEGTGL
jgi:hypothetical protein